jgi:hypothetical protein
MKPSWLISHRVLQVEHERGKTGNLSAPPLGEKAANYFRMRLSLRKMPDRAGMVVMRKQQMVDGTKTISTN